MSRSIDLPSAVLTANWESPVIDCREFDGVSVQLTIANTDAEGAFTIETADGESEPAAADFTPVPFRITNDVTVEQLDVAAAQDIDAQKLIVPSPTLNEGYMKLKWAHSAGSSGNNALTAKFTLKKSGKA